MKITNIMDPLTPIATFVTVVDTGSFSAAARKLGISPSAISRQIGHLEDRLGARLLNRTTRKLALTEVGAGFHARARDILAALDEAERSVNALTASPRGHLRVSLPYAFGQDHVAPIVPEFLKRFPDITLSMESTDRFLDLVDEGLDVAIRAGEMHDSSLIARRLAPFHWVVCGAPSYFTTHGMPQRPDDLSHHKCLSLAQHGNNWLFADGTMRRSVRIAPLVTSNNPAILIDAAKAGQGLARLASYTVGEAIRAGLLAVTLSDYELQDTGIYVVYPASRHLSPKVRAFVDYLVETIGGRAYWQRVGLA